MFSERGIVFCVCRSGIGVFFRTGCCFWRLPFGNLGVFPNGVLFSALSVREFGCFPNGVLFSASSVRELGCFSERGVVFCVVRSGIWVFSRTGCCFWRLPFGNWGVFPNGVLFSASSVRELGCFSERSVVSGVIRSGIGVFSRTECCFWRLPFGNLGVFPDGVLFSASSVRELGCFPERGVVSGVFRSGIGVFSRTGCCSRRPAFGNLGIFPNGVLFSALSVRELGCFSGRGVVPGALRSGIWVFSRTEGALLAS